MQNVQQERALANLEEAQSGQNVSSWQMKFADSAMADAIHVASNNSADLGGIAGGLNWTGRSNSGRAQTQGGRDRPLPQDSGLERGVVGETVAGGARMSPRLCPPAGSALKVAVLVAATGLGSARPALGQGGPSAELCNRGTITLHAARALHSLSILTGDTYQVEGWFTIEPGRCQTVFMAGNGDEAYVGFTAMDSHERLRHVAAIPARDMGIIQGAAQTICVAATAFKYAVRTKTELSRCKLGYQAMEFSLYIDPSQAHAERTTLDVAPSEQVLGTVLDNSNSANARLIFGDSVYLYGTEWSFINGRRLPAELIDRKTGLPPLLPKWQHDHTRSPVADDVAKLKDMLRAFRTCTVNVGFRFQISEPRFDLDDYGVVLASEVSAMQMSDGLHPSTSSDGAAIANLDLAGAAIREMGPDCILVSIACKGGQCVRSGSSATVYWAIHLNTRDQANEALAILRSIATYYPDGRGEITGKR